MCFLFVCLVPEQFARAWTSATRSTASVSWRIARWWRASSTSCSSKRIKRRGVAFSTTRTRSCERSPAICSSTASTAWDPWRIFSLICRSSAASSSSSTSRSSSMRWWRSKSSDFGNYLHFPSSESIFYRSQSKPVLSKSISTRPSSFTFKSIFNPIQSNSIQSNPIQSNSI